MHSATVVHLTVAPPHRGKGRYDTAKLGVCVPLGGLRLPDTRKPRSPKMPGALLGILGSRLQLQGHS